MKLEIVTPQRRLLETTVDDVVVPGIVGELGILPGHTACLTQLGTGVLHYHGSEGSAAFMVSGGICEVLDDRVCVLAEYAVPASEINVDETDKHIKQLEGELLALPAGDEHASEIVTDIERGKASISAALHR